MASNEVVKAAALLSAEIEAYNRSGMCRRRKRLGRRLMQALILDNRVSRASGAIAHMWHGFACSVIQAFLQP